MTIKILGNEVGADPLSGAGLLVWGGPLNRTWHVLKICQLDSNYAIQIPFPKAVQLTTSTCNSLSLILRLSVVDNLI